MSGAGACRDDLDKLPNKQPSRHNEGPWCDDCHGYTHMPWCPSYEQPSSDTESSLPIPDSEKLERFIRATGEPTVMQALMWIQRQRANEQPASAKVNEWRADSDGYGGFVWQGGALLAKTIEPARAVQIVTEHNQHQHCATQLQFLANRAEELSSLLAGMTTERDGLREVLSRMCDKFYPHACNVNGPERTCDRCSTLRQASAALNHAEQGEGS